MNLWPTWLTKSISDFLNLPVIPDGEHKLTVFMALHLILLVVALFYFTNFLRRFLIGGVLAKIGQMDIGSRHAVGTICSYVVMSLGLLVILDTAGIDITVITVLAGALGIGISMSLQHIVSNFMSGLIILVERPIKVGDRVEVANVVGEVVDISLRSSTILTSDNIAIIVPNSEFISAKVTNWSYNNKLVRFRLPISIPRETDPEEFTKALLRISAEQPEVMPEPAPEVVFQTFGEKSQDFVLLVWCKDASHPERLQSHLNYAISRHLKNDALNMPVGEGQLEQVESFGIAPFNERIVASR